jgi:hypothetical protein
MSVATVKQDETYISARGRWLSLATTRSMGIHPNLIFFPEDSPGFFIFIIHGPPNLCLQAGTIKFIEKMVSENGTKPHTIILKHAYPPRRADDREMWKNKLPVASYDPISWENLSLRLTDAVVDSSHRFLSPYIMLDTDWWPLFYNRTPDSVERISVMETALLEREKHSRKWIQTINDEFDEWEKEMARIASARVELDKLRKRLQK